MVTGRGLTFEHDALRTSPTGASENWAPRGTRTCSLALGQAKKKWNLCSHFRQGVGGRRVVSKH